MEIEIKKPYLEYLLEKASVVPVGVTAPLSLQGFLFSLKEGKILEVCRTDTLLSVLARTDMVTVLDESPPLEVLIHSDRLSRLVKSLESDTIQMKTLSSENVEIKAGNYFACWRSLSLSKFPRIPLWKEDELSFISLDSEKFIEAVSRVLPVADQEGFQINLRQLYFQKGLCWATDGFSYREVVTGLPSTFDLILPIIAAKLVKFIKLSQMDSFLFAEDNSFYYFVLGKDVFVCRVSNVSPPSVESLLSVLSGEKQIWFLVEKKHLIDLVSRIGITCEEGSKRVSFSITDDRLTISGKDDMGNQSQESLVIGLQGSKKGKRTFDIHWEFFIKILNSMKEETVCLAVDRDFVILKEKSGYAVLPLLRR